MITETKTFTQRKTVKSRPAKAKKPSVVTQYSRFFISSPSFLWQNDNVNYSLEQPHVFEDVPTETVYISPALTDFSHIQNA